MLAPSTVSARIVACCAAALALFGCSAGCSAGQITQTDSQVAAVEGSFGDVGSIALRNALIPYPQNREGAYPPGSAVPVLLAIINQSNVTDQLIAVTSPAASQVLLLGTTQIPPGSTVTSIAGPFITSEPTSPLVVGQLRIVLITNQVLHAGLNTPVTFQFRNAGKITLQVPMGSASNSES